MIGSHTMIVKFKSKYELHVFGGGICFLQEDCKKWGVTPFEKMRDTVKGWGKPDEKGLSEEETIRIADATGHLWSGNQEQKDNQFYSKYAGDGVYLLDLDDESFSRRDRDNKLWVPVV